jgi:uncharacterized protein YdaU (DUF1376 family)
LSEQKFTHLVRLSLHLGDYHRRTSHLSAAENGAFFSLICHYWSNGGLPEGDDQLARVGKMTLAEWRRHKHVVAGLFEQGWRLPWLDAELQDAKDRSRRRSENGKRGNEKRWGEGHANADRFACEKRSQSDRKAIASGSLPPASPHLEDSQQEGTIPSDQDEMVTSAVVPFPRGRA